MPSYTTLPRRLVIRRAVELAVIVVLLAVIILLGQFLRRTRQAAYQHMLQSQHAPTAALQQIKLKMTLLDYQHDINRLDALFPPRDAIGDVVSRLEQEARRHNVEVQIPEIKEELKLDKDKKPIPATGPFVDVRLQVRASGAPADLLAFLHAIEHSSYILRIPGWQLDVLAKTASTSLQARSVPVTAGDAPAAQPNSELAASIILTMKNRHEN